MQKVLFLFTLLAFCSAGLKAQTQITHAGGPQNYGGITVTVSSSGSTGHSIGGVCGTAPYIIGVIGDGSYTYSFSQPVTHVRVQMARLNSNDSITFNINGAMVPVIASNLSAYGGTCGLSFSAVASPNGRLSSTLPQLGSGDNSGVEINLTNPVPPYSISSFSVSHTSQIGSPHRNGVTYNVAFKDEPCNIPFAITTADSTPCSGRCLVLEVPDFDNATYTWSSLGATPAVVDKDTFHRSFCNFSLFQDGTYIATATRGACFYTDTIFIQANNTPSVPLADHKYDQGLCRGAEDSLWSTTQGAVGVQYYWYRPGGVPIKGQNTPANEQDFVIPSFAASDEGQYCVYAETSDGCVTDTTCIVLSMLPDVVAEFDLVQTIPGCVGDTIKLRNNSTGASVGYIWRFPDVYTANLRTTTTDSEIVTNIYGVPSRADYVNNLLDPADFVAPRNYEIELVAINAGCRDSIMKTFSFHHNLEAGFQMDKDAVCQGYEGDTVHFDDTSSTPIGGPHKYTWHFGQPNTLPATSTDDTSFFYKTSSLNSPNGMFIVKLVVEDFMGCKDSVEKEIFVDSTGPIVFTSSDTIVCAGERILFQGDLNRVGLEGNFWQFGDGSRIADTGNVIYNYDLPGLYTVSFNASYRVCRDTFAEQTILVKPFPTLDLGPDTTMCPNGVPVTIFDRTLRPGLLPTDEISWKWHTPYQDSGTEIVVRGPGVYAATVTLNGCATSDSVTVRKDCYIDIPNAFTPDGDGQNDYFLPRQLLSRSVASFKMTVYSRWGQKVFETTSPNGRGWDGMFNGEPQPMGVYIYQIEAAFGDNSDNIEQYQGNVTLLR